MIVFKRFQTRLIVFFVALLALLQLLVFTAVNDANIRNAKLVIKENLQLGASVFNRLLEERTRNLFQHARLISSDYAFKPAFYSGDRPTILSALENHLQRIEDADIMLLVDLDLKIIADTRSPDLKKETVAWPELIEQAEQNDYAEATGVVLIDNLPFQIIVVPYLSPDINAWILLGFAIDQQVADDLKMMINSEISFFVSSDSRHWELTRSTLDKDKTSALKHKNRLQELSFNQGQTFTLESEEYIVLYTRLAENKTVIAMLQRSLDQALKPYLRLKQTLQILMLLGLLLSLFGALFIARKVTKPVKALTLSVQKIEQGDYRTKIITGQKDEIGQLAGSFNQMAKGLEEKEKVRNLLGKVVSKEVAEELLCRKIELGGEEKLATVLFSDIRDFTSLCEGAAAQEILAMLNVYLTEMSSVIEFNHGVIDKYIGDAIMALFGVPVNHGNDAHNAVATAMAMNQVLQKLNKDKFGKAIKIGIGLNTGRVVAGNMGSPDRLNYTVIGDDVNLASRLEGLTKFYDLPVLVSESTRNAADSFVYQEIDRVRVKGKQNAVAIFRPVALLSQISQSQWLEIEICSVMLSAYRAQNWKKAQEQLDQLELIKDSEFCRIYRQRIQIFQTTQPPDNWDFTFEFTEK
ncbi:adenylate/guanylate cyclase domain-containing protein [Psychromonas aquimarina]|uniref:adenylate/guanylate cyclase domain-containing protein n=1 Tax=Psychromonas aquimarina TaxID=444919 RepID=UPI0003FDE2F7|nr:adenylate/guanylate cyclase domain-containing protein [Psychromonas aquimarina]